MRRLFLCWLALTAAVVAVLALAPSWLSPGRANMVQMPFTTGGGPPPFSSTCATPGPSNNFISRARAANGGAALPTTPAYETAYDAMICKLVATDPTPEWPTLEALWIMAAPNAAVANLNLVANTFPLVPTTAGNAPTFTAGAGYTGVLNSATVYIDTGFIPSSSGTGKYTLNSAHVMAWSLTNQQTNNYQQMMGTQDASNGTIIVPWSVTSLFGLNEANGGFAGIPDVDSLGSYVAVRVAVASQSVYRKGTFQSPTDTTHSSTALPTLSFYLLASHPTGSPIGVGLQLAAASIGGSLTAAQVSSNSNTTGTGLVPAVCAYLTTVHGSC
jgi:hypothetical protein